MIYNRRYRDMHGTRSIDLVNEGVSFETILRNAVARGEIRDAEGCVEAWVAERLAGIAIPRARMYIADLTGAGSRSTSAKLTTAARSQSTPTSPT